MFFARKSVCVWLLPAYSTLVLCLVALSSIPAPHQPRLGAEDAWRARQALATLPAAAALFRAADYDGAALAFERVARDLPPAEHANGAGALLGLTGARHYLRLLASVHGNAGASRFRARQFELSMASLETAIAIDPAAVQPRLTLGAALKHQRRYAEAVAVFESAIVRGARGPKLLLDLGEVSLRQGDRVRARWALTQARRGPPGDVQEWGTALEAEHFLAQIDEDDGRLEEAEAGLRAVLVRAPGYAEARYRLARVLSRLGPGRAREAEDARRRFAADSTILSSIESALAAQPGRVTPIQWVADTYRALGLLHLAEARYRQLVARNPDDTKALLALHDLRVRAGVSPRPANVGRLESTR